LGVKIAPARQKAFLASLNLTPVPEATPELEASQVTVKIPTYRVDLKREADLIEEVGRLYGVDKIPSRLMIGSLGSNPYDKVVDFLNDVRSLLVGMAFTRLRGKPSFPKPRRDASALVRWSSRIRSVATWTCCGRASCPACSPA
jgi:hypothetical protein